MCPASSSPARHQCFIYEGAPSSHLADIAKTLAERLSANRRCLYLNSPPMVAGLRWQLSAAGVDLDLQLKRGALILSSDQSHLVSGKFDVGRMIQLLGNSLGDAIADGFEGLFASGDMTWEFGSEANLGKLLEYENSLEEFMQKNPAMSGICLYHRDSLPPHAIQTAMMTHASLYLNSSLSEINPRYYEHFGKEG